MSAILSTLLEEFKEKLEKAKTSTPRLASFPEARNLIKVATGMRRAGKTYFMLQKILELLNAGVPLESILYLNFEDDRLLPMNYQAMGKLLDEFYTLYPENHTRECYLFLDEVQNIPDWAIVVRRFFDSKNVQIYLTGSSAKLLSTEIATSLRGRSLATEILPFSFTEFLKAHNVTLPKQPWGKKSLDEMRKQLLLYFQIGGFPAVQFLSPPEQQETLQGYVDTVIFRDIVERHKITNISLLRYTVNTLLKNSGAPFSINKFHNNISSQGHKISKDTLYNYLSYAEDAYLIFAVPHFAQSVRIMQTMPKKVYAIDSGLLLANTFNLTDNYGKLLENLIYLDLRREGKDVFYYKTKSGFEIDFVATSRAAKPEIIQAVWDASDAVTLEREERALREAEAELGIKGRIIDFVSYLARL